MDHVIYTLKNCNLVKLHRSTNLQVEVAHVNVNEVSILRLHILRNLKVENILKTPTYFLQRSFSLISGF